MAEYPEFSSSRPTARPKSDDTVAGQPKLANSTPTAWFWAALGMIGLAIAGQLYLVFDVFSLVSKEADLASQVAAWKESETSRSELLQQWSALESNARTKSQSERDQIAALDGLIKAKELEYQDFLAKLATERAALESVRLNSIELQSQISTAEEKARSSAAASTEADLKRNQILQEIASLETRKTEAETAESSLRNTIALLETQRDELTKTTQTKQTLIAQMEQRLTNTQSQLNDIEDNVSERLQLTARSEALKETVKSLEATKSTLVTKISDLQTSIDLADQNAVNANKRLADTRNQVLLAQDSLVTRQKDLDDLDAQIAVKMASLQKQQVAEQALASQLATAAQKLRDLSSISVTALTEVNENAAASLRQMADQSRQALTAIQTLQEIQRQITEAAKKAAEAKPNDARTELEQDKKNTVDDQSLIERENNTEQESTDGGTS